jgi:hypothetical protein
MRSVLPFSMESLYYGLFVVQFRKLYNCTDSLWHKLLCRLVKDLYLDIHISIHIVQNNAPMIVIVILILLPRHPFRTKTVIKMTVGIILLSAPIRRSVGSCARDYKYRFVHSLLGEIANFERVRNSNLKYKLKGSEANTICC